MYEIKVLPKDDPYIPTAEKAVAALAYAGIPGQSLVDVLPIPTNTSYLLCYLSEARSGVVSKSRFSLKSQGVAKARSRVARCTICGC